MANIIFLGKNHILAAGFVHVLQPMHNIEMIFPQKTVTEWKLPEHDLLVIPIADLGWERAMTALYHLSSKPNSRIIILDQIRHPGREIYAYLLGANEYLSMDCTPENLRSSIAQILQGKNLLGKRMHGLQDTRPFPKLSVKYLKILDALYHAPLIGTREIAKEIHVSYGRAKNMLTDLFRLFQVETRLQLAAKMQAIQYFPNCAYYLHLVYEEIPKGKMGNASNAMKARLIHPD